MAWASKNVPALSAFAAGYGGLCVFGDQLARCTWHMYRFIEGALAAAAATEAVELAKEFFSSCASQEARSTRDWLSKFHLGAAYSSPKRAYGEEACQGVILLKVKNLSLGW